MTTCSIPRRQRISPADAARSRCCCISFPSSASTSATSRLASSTIRTRGTSSKRLACEEWMPSDRPASRSNVWLTSTKCLTPRIGQASSVRSGHPCLSNRRRTTQRAVAALARSLLAATGSTTLPTRHRSNPAIRKHRPHRSWRPSPATAVAPLRAAGCRSTTAPAVATRRPRSAPPATASRDTGGRRLGYPATLADTGIAR